MKYLIIGAIASTLISTAASAIEIENRNLDEMYAAAMAEGGKLNLSSTLWVSSPVFQTGTL